jgi:hypothetical protein
MGQGESIEGFYDKPKSIPDSDQSIASKSLFKAPPLQIFLQIPFHVLLRRQPPFLILSI